MGTIDVREGALDALSADLPHDGPLVLLNLLRFSEETKIDGQRSTGREVYQRYVRQIEPAIIAVGGRPLFRGEARTMLIGPPDERWDEIILVRYPSREAFERMVSSSEYRSSAHLRLAALDDSRLVAVTAAQRIGRVKGFIYALSVRARRRGS